MVLNRAVFHICFRKTPWACVKAKSQDLHTTLSLKLDSAAGRYRLYRVLYTYFLI